MTHLATLDRTLRTTSARDRESALLLLWRFSPSSLCLCLVLLSWHKTLSVRCSKIEISCVWERETGYFYNLWIICFVIIKSFIIHCVNLILCNSHLLAFCSSLCLCFYAVVSCIVLLNGITCYCNWGLLTVVISVFFCVHLCREVIGPCISWSV